MALNIANWFTIGLVQGSADAFVQNSIATDIVPENGVILRVTQIHFVIESNLSAIAADSQVEWSLTRATKTAVAGLSDNDAFLYDSFSYSLTTSGAVIFKQGFFYQDLVGIYLAEPTIYAQLDSTATAIAITARLRVFYEEQKASEVDILRILNAPTT